MQYQIPNEDKKLFQALTNADRSTQVTAAANLVKTGRWDVLSWIAHKPGMLRDVREKLSREGYNLAKMDQNDG